MIFWSWLFISWTAKLSIGSSLSTKSIKSSFFLKFYFYYFLYACISSKISSGIFSVMLNLFKKSKSFFYFFLLLLPPNFLTSLFVAFYIFSILVLFSSLSSPKMLVSVNSKLSSPSPENYDRMLVRKNEKNKIFLTFILKIFRFT